MARRLTTSTACLFFTQGGWSFTGKSLPPAASEPDANDLLMSGRDRNDNSRCRRRDCQSSSRSCEPSQPDVHREKNGIKRAHDIWSMKIKHETTERPLFGSQGGSHPLGRFTDQQETYGPQVVAELVAGLSNLKTVVDLGAGSGRDLSIVRKSHPHARLIAIEGGYEYAQFLRGKADKIYVKNIEVEKLPFADGEVDLIMDKRNLLDFSRSHTLFEDWRIFSFRRPEHLFPAQSFSARTRQTSHSAQGVFCARKAFFQERHSCISEGLLSGRIRTRSISRRAILSIPAENGARPGPRISESGVHNFFPDPQEAGVCE
jgi:hypothetical protein